MSSQYYVYILASARNGTLYIGVTNDVGRRTGEHKDGLVRGFTKRYGVRQLVWYEVHDEVNLAIAREKQIKGWNRIWKIRLIERSNPGWDDLSEGLWRGSILDSLPSRPSGRSPGMTVAR